MDKRRKHAPLPSVKSRVKTFFHIVSQEMQWTSCEMIGYEATNECWDQINRIVRNRLRLCMVRLSLTPMVIKEYADLFMNLEGENIPGYDPRFPPPSWDIYCFAIELMQYPFEVSDRMQAEWYEDVVKAVAVKDAMRRASQGLNYRPANPPEARGYGIDQFPYWIDEKAVL